MHDDLGLKNQTTGYILPRHWLYESLNFIVVELIRFFHGALQLFDILVLAFKRVLQCWYV